MRLGYFLFVVLTIMTGCSEKTNYEHDLRQVLLQEAAINKELASMKDSIGREWDFINELLAENLPKEMPSIEKSNILKVRNANLIRMFESFDALSDDVKQALSEVEKKDREMSFRVNLVKKQAQAIEDQKLLLFEAIRNVHGEQALKEYVANQVTTKDD